MSKLEFIDAYPLEWPASWARTKPSERKNANFHTKKSQGYGSRRKNITEARNFVIDELRRYGVDVNQSVVISSDIVLRKDGLPHGGANLPDDPGVCVYFLQDGELKHFPLDIYDRAPDNLYAIGLIIESLRTIYRHGGDRMGKATSSGLKALPQTGSGKKWWDVLGVDRDDSTKSIRMAYKSKVKAFHPDKPGGSQQKFQEIQDAFQQAKQARWIE